MALSQGPPTATGRTARWAARGILVVGVLFVVVGISLLMLFGFSSPGLPAAIWGLLLIVVYGFFEPDVMRGFLGQGQLQAGTRALAMVLLVFAAVILVNVFARDRLGDKQLDLSKNRVNSLAPQTVQIVQSLDKPITATIWSQSTPGDNQAAFDLLSRYRSLNGKLTIHSYVLQDRPTLAVQQGVQAANSVVFETSGHPSEIATDLTEQGFDTVLQRLSTGKSPTAYFLTGHGEPSTTTPSSSSLTLMTQALQKQGFKVKVLNLAAGGAPAPAGSPGIAVPTPAAPAASPAAQAPQPPDGTSFVDATPTPTDSAAPAPAPTPVAPAPGPATPAAGVVASDKVPADADELIVFDPRTNLAASEIAAINAYLDGGGHLLVSQGPGQTSNVNELLTRFGLSTGGGLVLDPQLQANNRQAGFLQLTTYGQHIISRGLDNLPSQFVDSPVQGTAKTGFTVTPVVTTTNQACFKTDLTGPATCSAGDKKGPFNFVVAVEQTNAKAGAKPVRAVVMGGALFASDIYAANQVAAPPGNQPLVINAANWLAGQDKIINVPPHTNAVQNIFLTDAQKQLVLVGYPVLLPLLLLGLGVNSYLRRR